MDESSNLLAVCVPTGCADLDLPLTVLQELRKEHCPPLDESLFFAIASDYDLSNLGHVRELVAVLDSLKTTAAEQDNADFDPSGTGWVGYRHQDESPEAHSSPEDRSTSNGVTSITAGLSDLNWDDTTDIGANLEEMPFETKEDWLKTMFPDIASYTIASTLKKCNSALNRSIDELLNLSFLDQNGVQSPMPKGVDGFLEEHKGGRGHKGRRKRKIRPDHSSRATSSTSALSDMSNAPQNVWTTLSEDVDFICARTNLPQQIVKSAFHTNAASLSATIRALAQREAAQFKTLEDLDPTLQLQFAVLKTEFHFLPESLLFGLLSMARKFPSAAHELTEAMMVSRGQEMVEEDAAKYASPNLPQNSEDVVPGSRASWSKVELSEAKSALAAHGSVASTAFSRASAAFRRGKSDHLMGGAAAYYASVGREHAKAMKELHSALADAHVASQSSSSALDLHGVSVADAVRIAKARVNTWWENLGDAKYAPGGGGPARDGYRIVTGIGRHSRDGAPRIGPAITRTLVRQGWKVEVGRGEAIVTGRARR